MSSRFREGLTIAEEEDDVFGPMLSRTEFQGGIQRHPGLSIPVRRLLLQVVQICTEEVHTHTRAHTEVSDGSDVADMS